MAYVGNNTQKIPVEVCPGDYGTDVQEFDKSYLGQYADQPAPAMHNESAEDEKGKA